MRVPLLAGLLAGSLCAADADRRTADLAAAREQAAHGTSGTPGATADPAASSQPVEYGEVIDCGLVVVRGKLVLPPFRVGYRQAEVFVNDERVAVVGDGGDGARSPEKVMGPGRPVAAMVAAIELRLYNSEALIAFDDHTRLFLDEDAAVSFLHRLVQAESAAERARIAATAALDLAVTDDVNVDDGAPIITARWREVLAGFQPSDALGDFLAAYEGRQDVDEGERAASVPSWPDEARSRRMYLLNVVGLLLIVLSCGVLVARRPESSMRWSQVCELDSQLQMVRQCLILVVVLSAFDLVCTLWAGASTHFAELNVWGDSLLRTPAALVAFKTTATLLGAGILLVLRQYSGAQRASWWMCLLLTVLAVRWVAVQSLLYG